MNYGVRDIVAERLEAVWDFERRDRKVDVRVEGHLIFNTSPPQVDAALAGLGVVLLSEDELVSHISTGRLLSVLEDWCPKYAGYDLYFPSRRQPFRWWLKRCVSVHEGNLPVPGNAIVSSLCRPVAHGMKSNLRRTDVMDQFLASDAARSAAQIIAAARMSLKPLAPLPQRLVPKSVEDGYRVQSEVHRLLATELGPLVGYKIGCTSEVMQKYLAIPHPCAGGVHERGAHQSGVVLNAADFVRVGVECEIAVRLERDLIAGGAPFTSESVAASIECYLPAIEIVDDRYVQWETLGAPTIIADDFFAAGIVLGRPVARSEVADLLNVEGRAMINGQEAGRGTAADVLGHPHNALAWLANHLASQGTGLRAGEIVMTGSLVKTVWLEAGDRATMEFGGLGNVQVTFV